MFSQSARQSNRTFANSEVREGPTFVDETPRYFGNGGITDILEASASINTLKFDISYAGFSSTPDDPSPVDSLGSVAPSTKAILISLPSTGYPPKYHVYDKKLFAVLQLLVDRNVDLRSLTLFVSFWHKSQVRRLSDSLEQLCFPECRRLCADHDVEFACTVGDLRIY